jgi:hypothetical protein
MHRTSLKLIRLQNIASPPSRPSLLKRSISAFGRFVRVVVFDVERGSQRVSGSEFAPGATADLICSHFTATHLCQNRQRFLIAC